MSEEGRYIKGGDGSHWVGCEETHWDCKIARLEKENARLQKEVEEAEVVIMEYAIQEGTTAGARDWLKKYRGWVEKELQK